MSAAENTAAASNDAAAASASKQEEEEEEDLETLQAEIARMEAEAARIAQETENIEATAASGGSSGDKDSGASAGGGAASGGEGTGRDGFSIYVGQVDYSTQPEELLAHFEPCGTVERVTIVCDRVTGRPKGFAYLEFQTEAAVENAIKLDGSTFKERQLKVSAKRVNDPNYYAGAGGGAPGGRGGRGFRGGGRGYRGGYRGGRGGRGGFRGGGRGGRGGYQGGYHPYY
mmetsp:Transcript_8230/g.11098  ORF Transcript_8230/g.11098 Transcript_8230/m.11098 type:complete len:229 (+) Transcript_8230:174-860(+)